MNFSRKTILVVGAVLLAACGDKVSVQEYTPPAAVPKINSVAVSPGTASMLVGETATFTAAVNADAGLATTVTWASSDAASASVSATGVVTAVKASPGVAICATSTVDTGKKGCATVAVRAVTATALTVAPSSASLLVNQTVQLTAALSGATGTATWTTSDATKATVSATGLVTAVAVTPGVAVCAAAAGFNACATIVVSAVSITGVSISPATATLAPNEFIQLTASIAGGNGATNTFTWTSADAAVTVDANGKATAVSATTGTAVCAASTQDSSKRACANIIVKVPTPTGLSVTPSTAALNINQTVQLTATVSGPPATPTWTTGDATKVTVSTAGLVTAVAATAGTAVCASVPGIQTCANIIVNPINVTGVSVTPSTATMYPNDVITLQKTVSGTGGVTNTVTWSSSDIAKVTVDANGVVTAVATTAGAAVCATSTQDATKQGCAAITVIAKPVLTPATVSINSITATATGLGVNPAAVAGNIDVTLNINSGSYTVSKVVLEIGGIPVDSQLFSSAQAAALRYASEQAFAGQLTTPQIVFTVNTAKASATTGIPLWLNGDRAVKAYIFTTVGGTTAPASASAQTNLTFANVNTFAATTSATGTTATANSAAGFTYTKGSLAISLIPVSYTGAVLSAVNVNFGTGGATGCDANLTAQRTIALTAPAAGSFAWTGTLSGTAAAAAANVGNYEFAPGAAACVAAGTTLNSGERFAVINAQDATGAAWVAGLPLAVGSFYRLDNKAPAAPAFNLVLNYVGRRQANWANDVIQLNRTNANSGIFAAVPADAGVGVSTTEANVFTTTVAGQGVLTDVTTLAETATNVIATGAYSITATAKDLLGNATAAIAAAPLGIDRTIPTFVLTAAAANATVPAPGASAYTATYSDAAVLPAGPAGPTATPLRVATVRRATAAATLVNWNGAIYTTTGVTQSVGLAGGFIDPSGANLDAYYTVTWNVEDGAGNASAAVTRTYITDATAPTGPFSIPIMTTSAGLSNLFSSAMTDNIDIASSQWQMEYAVLGVTAPGALGAAGPAMTNAQFRLPATAFSSFGSFLTSATDNLNYPLYRSMIATAAGYVAGAGQGLLSVSHQVADRAGTLLAFPVVGTAIPGVNLPAAATADPLAAAIATGFTYAGFINATAAAAGNLDISGNATGVHVNSVNLIATATGAGNTMILPFARVEFWSYDAVTNTYRYIGQSSSPTLVDTSAPARVFTWTVPFSCGGSAYACTGGAVVGFAQPIIAIGVTSTNDAVRTVNNTLITTQP